MPSQAVPLPPPFKGQNDQLPEFSVQNPFCIRMENFEVNNGLARLRRGHSRFARKAGSEAWAIADYDGTLFAVVNTGANTEIYNVTGGSYVLAHTVAGARSEVLPLIFNKYLYFFARVGGNLVAQYDGTTWGAVGYVSPGFNIFPGCAHKNRAYFYEINGSRIAYGNIDAISGALTVVDLSSVISGRGQVTFMASISLSENVTQENVLAIGFTTGEILVYSGSYPNSASWALAARLQTSPLVLENRVIAAKGDAFLLTKSEVVSLRNLISRGYSTERAEGIGAAIENRYKQLVDSGSLLAGVYNPIDDRLYIYGYTWANTSGSTQYGIGCLIYDFALGSWFESFMELDSSNNSSIAVQQACFSVDSIYAHVYYGPPTDPDYAAIVYKLGAKTDGLDDGPTSGTQGIPFTLKSAPAPINRFGVVKADGLEVIMKSDIYPAINFKLIGDLGAQQTAAQTTSGNGTNVTKAFVNLGIEANTIQYEISGTSTSSSTGIEIYATNMWVTPGNGVAR